MPAIESNDFTIGDLLKDFYAVPDYQREYVWDDEQVEQLLSDIRAEQSNAPTTEYFIGSIVTCNGRNDRFDLIDGQQRMTIIFVVVCAVRDRLRYLGQNSSAGLDSLLATHKFDEKGQESLQVRLDLQYDDARDLIKELVEGRIAELRNRTRSMANIINAYETATRFFRSEFAEDTDALRAFFGYFINRVKLIRVRTENVARALKIFETINDRGVSLNAMDLLKNLLFMKANPIEFDKLKEEWKSLINALDRAGEKPLRFLRYVILAKYGEQQLREDELYGWLVANEPRIGYAKQPISIHQDAEQGGTILSQLNEWSRPEWPAASRRSGVTSAEWKGDTAAPDLVVGGAIATCRRVRGALP